MKKLLIDILQERVLLADGGIGMELYSRGFFVNRCYDELNLSASGTVEEIHRAFAKGGAEIIRTNTFGANRPALAAHGFAEHVEKVNRAGVQLAKKAAGDDHCVAGSIGPVLCAEWPDEKEKILNAHREQAKILLEESVDLLILEAFPGLDYLLAAYEAIKSVSSSALILPSLAYNALKGEKKPSPEKYIQSVKTLGAPLAGVNGGSPKELIDILPALAKAAGKDIYLAVFPDAGDAEVVDGRTLYLASPEYLADYTRRFVQMGVSIVGGDAGITPRMTREMSSYLRSVQPRNVVEVISELSEKDFSADAMTPIPVEGRSPFGRSLKKDFVVSVELDPPKGIDTTKAVQGAKFLYEHGIDAINIADGPRASGRMSPIALSILVRRVVPIETIVHVCCRDRNLLALQMDLISANALGLRNLMIITGDPPKMGIYPDATAVFDLDSIGLVKNVSLLNRGLDFAKRPLKGQTAFVTGVGCNPGATDIDLEARRYEQKVNAGAEFVFSQPIYDPEILERFLKKIEHVKPIPFFVGVLPLSSLKNAEFFNDNVPGMQVPQAIMKRLATGSTKEEQCAEGIRIAAEALREAKKYPLVQGAYIFPPFGHYERILDVLELSGIW